MMRRFSHFHAKVIGTLAMGAGCVIRGLSWMPFIPEQSAPNEATGAPAILSSVFPLWLVGLVWMGLGLFAIASAASNRHAVALNGIGGMCAMWGALFAIAAVFPPEGAQTSRDWISAATYVSMGIYVLATVHLSSKHLEEVG